MEWTGARYADKPTAEVQTWIDAPPDRVWRLVADISLMPELSDELQSVEWVCDEGSPSVGATFRGHSKHDALGEWSTLCHIVECEPNRVFAWAVEDPDEPTATWRFTLVPERGGTSLTQWMQMGPARSGLSFAIDAMPDKEQKIVFVRMREFEQSMTRVVAQIKAMAEDQ
ncbi:SRPBCC family protein [Mycobacterium sp. URHB0044]|uniref:SRPBCC family protein n=1 Tax=Mycobacterium sp. URHB0044 TaxID=1380386 RepID=UPI000490F544|nr:SRPBCC family protein [Mycobacterium sp. URHB0044]